MGVKSRKKARAFVREYKKSGECYICGEDHYACLEFHHIEEKKIGISQAVSRGWSVGAIMKEIEKCKIVCSNCHRKIHYTPPSNGEPQE